MRPLVRDVTATVLVALSLIVYAGWVWAVGPFESIDVRVVTVIVLVAGIAASMVAVVPGFEGLIHGSRLYLAVASGAGVVALVAGIWALVQEDANALAILMAATIAMWAMSTLRHASVRGPEARLGHR